MYKVKVIAFLKSGIKREGKSNLITESEYKLTGDLFSNLGGPGFHTLMLVIEDNIVEYIPTREVEFIAVIGTKQDENTDNDRTPQTR